MFKYYNKFMRVILLIVFLTLLSINQVRALPICMDAGVTNTKFGSSAREMSDSLTNFTQQEINYINQSYDSLEFLVKKRLKELRSNTINWLTDWANNRLQPVLQDMMQQISVNYMEQSLLLSKVIDAHSINDHYLENDRTRIASHRRYEPTVSTGVLDTFGPGLIQGYQLTKAFAYSLLKSELELYSNTKDTISENGPTAVFKEIWDDFTEYLCHPDLGNVGCNDTAVYDDEVAGKHRDISRILWGPNKSVDMSQLKNRKMLRYALRFFIYPQVNDPIPPGSLASAQAREELLKRRADMARLNVVYHSLSNMLAERIGGSSKMAPYVKEVRAAADINSDQIALNPSYREVNEAVNKDRFLAPDYFVSLTTKSQEQVLREQLALGAFKLQMMNDLFRRQEEMLLITASDYSMELDSKTPSIPVSSISTGSP